MNWQKLKRKLWLATHRPVDPTLYEQILTEDQGLLDGLMPIGLIDIIYYLDDQGQPALSFRGENPEGGQLDLFTMLAMLELAKDSAREAAQDF